MLDGLDEVGWEKLAHAYGKAKDIPALLRGLTSTTAKTRDKAISQLAASICHQGTLYTATSKAVPFLVELALASKVKDRENILRLLADIATLDDHERFLLDGFPRTLDGAPATFKRAIAAVHASADVYVKLLADKSAPVRSAAAFLLAWIPASAPKSAPAVRAALAAEKDAGARASLALAAAYLDDKATFDDLLRAKGLGLRVAAALATSHVRRGEIDDGVRVILGAAAAKKTLKLEGVPWLGGDLAAFAVRVLAALPRSADTDGYLIDAMKAHGASATFAANVVVRRLFSPIASPAVVKEAAKARRVAAAQAKRRDQEEARVLAAISVKAASLDPLQRRAVAALAADTGFDGDLVTALEERGLPSTPVLMKLWLEGATAPVPSILDRMVSTSSLGDLYLAASAGKGEVKQDVIDAIRAALTPDEQIELAKKGLEDVEVSWSGAVAIELLWLAAPLATPAALATLKHFARKGSLYAVALGVAQAAIARAAKTAPDPKVDSLLQQTYGFWPRVRDAVAVLPLERRETWLLSRRRDDQGQPAEFFSGAWPYWVAAPTTKITDRALKHVAAWKPEDPWGGARAKFAEPHLEALIAALRDAGNTADAKRCEAALAKLRV